MNNNRLLNKGGPKMKKAILILVFITVFVFLLFSVNPYAEDAKTLKIGAIMPLSGGGALWGITALRGAELATDEINARGYLEIGAEKYKIKIISYDDRYVANEAVNAANKLIYQNKVKIIFGSIGSAPTLAFQEVTEPAKVISFNAGWNEKILSPDKPYTFRASLSSVEHAPLTAKWAVNKLGIKTLAIAHSSDATGEALARHFSEAFAAFGAKTVAYEGFERGTTDFYPLLTRIIAKKPDLIFGNLTPSENPLFVKQARELGYKGRTMSHGGSIQDYPRFVQIAGKDNAEGQLVTEDWNYRIENPKVEKLKKSYEEKYKEELGSKYLVLYYYDTAKALYYAMEKAGTTTDTDKIRAILETEEFDGVLGKWRFVGKETYGINHQRQPTGTWMTECQDGKQVFVEPI